MTTPAQTLAGLLLPLSLWTMPASSAEPAAPTPVTVRTWLNAQTSGALASTHKQTLSGPVMSRVHQKLLNQLGSGNGNGEAGSTSEADAPDAKDNPLGDLSKVLGNAKP